MALRAPSTRGSSLFTGTWAAKRHETVELLDLEPSGIRVSSYWTEALPRKQLERKLREAVRLARVRLDSRPS